MGNPPPDAYPPGTVLTVGSHKAMIVKYISAGGFAHVYIVKISPFDHGQEIACLKRVHVPNKATLNILRAEVDAMKRLKGAPCIVSYIDSHAARSPSNDGTYEVFLLMEYCSRNGLIDFLNSRLQNRLTEPEVLQIMYEVTIGLSQVHFLNPPLIHRDIKIENILINERGEYRLCDFGSSCSPLRPPRNPQELQILQNDILHYTTAQYRAPEMIDLTRGIPIDDKSDIWALGVFCYKICYYTTPFEHTGEPAILQSKFTFPSFPVYSHRLQNLITVLLTNDARLRPNVYHVLEEVCKMKSVPVPPEIQAQYLAHKQLRHQQALALQQQQTAALQQQQIQHHQHLQSSTIPPNSQALTSASPVGLPTHLSGQKSGASAKLYNDNLAKSTTSIKSIKSGKSVQSGQSAKSYQSAVSSASSSLGQNANITSVSLGSKQVTPAAPFAKTYDSTPKAKSSSTLVYGKSSSNGKGTDPFADLVTPAFKKLEAGQAPAKQTSNLTATIQKSSNTAAQPENKPSVSSIKSPVLSPNIKSSVKPVAKPVIKPAFKPVVKSPVPKITPFKPIDLGESAAIKPKRSFLHHNGSSHRNDELSTEVIDVDMKHLHLTGDHKSTRSSRVASPVNSPDLEALNYRQKTGDFQVKENTIGSSVRSDVKRTQSFHKRTISVGKNGFNKLSTSLTGKFRSASNNSRLSSSNTGILSSELNRTPKIGEISSDDEIDQSEDEMISDLAMREYKDADYAKDNSSMANSVQKKMEMLLTSKDEIVKTATGYGKYTDDDSSDAVASKSGGSKHLIKSSSFMKPITSKRSSLDFSRTKVLANSNSSNKTSRDLKVSTSKPPAKPAKASPLTAKPTKPKTKPLSPLEKTKKMPPPKPKKPAHLVSPKVKAKQWGQKTVQVSPTKKESTENFFFEDDGVIDENDTFEVNDFEKSFNEKFPRIV